MVLTLATLLALSWPEPTATMKPWVYNWWMGSAVDAAGLEYQCRELADKGFGGFHVIPTYGAKGYEKQWKTLLSPDWVEAWNLAAETAAKHGLGIDLTMGCGWCFGGPWIGEEDAASSGMKVKRAGPGGTGFMIDPFSAKAMSNHVARFEAAFGKNGTATRPRAFYHDSYEYFGAQPKDGRDPLESQIACFKVWTDWCRRNGCLSRNEGHGGPVNWLDLYALADIPETEMFGRECRDVLVSKFASSAAHLTGKKLVSAETCTWVDEHFHERPAEIKSVVDRLFLAGVNHCFYHGCCYSPVDAAWPGWCFYASCEMNPRNPIWREIGTLSAYITRCQSVFQTWEPDNDLVVLFDPPYTGKQMSVHNAAEWFHGPGGLGARAKALYEAGYQFDYASPRMLKAQPALKDRMDAAKAVKSPFGGLDGVGSVRLRKDGVRLYFVVSEKHDLHIGAERPFEVMDPMTGEISSRTDYWLEKGASCFVRLDSRPALAVSDRAPSVRPPLAVGASGWTVRLLAGGPVLPPATNLTGLVSWTQWDDAFSGTMLYEATFDCCDEGAAAELDLGDVREIARVRVNGRDLGCRLLAPYRFRIPAGVLKSKDNRLEVEVTNLGANRLRWNDLNHVNWKYFTDINMVDYDYKPLDAAKWQVLPSGLLGPVTLRSESDAADRMRSDEGHAATVTWRIASPQWLDDAPFATLEKTLVGHRVTGKIALFVTARGFVHHPLPLPELLDEAKVGAERLARLHALGYEAGFNLLCAIGHLNEMAHTTPQVEGARHNVSADGGESAADFCLESPAWREKYLTPALTALAQAKPDFIWLDDDVRVCYCADCQARRHRKIGSPLGVKEMGAWLCEPGTCASRRRALLQDNRESQADFFAFCARVVRAVDPKIVLGDMEVVNPAEGLAYPEKFAALGNGTYPTYWRSGCDCWNDETPNDFLVKLNRQAQMSVWLPRTNAKFEAEIENWPYQHYGKSVAFTVFETLLNCAVATDGAAYNVLHVESQDPFEVNRPMIDALEAIRPTLDAFVAAAGGARPRGVWNGVGRDTGAVAQPEGTDWMRDFPWGFDRGFLGTDAQKCGFSVAYRAEDADLIAPTALAVRSMTDAELDRMFSGGVYLDHDALLAALGRGREADIGFRAGKWMTDTALEVLTDDPLNAGFAGMVRNARPTLPPYCRVLSVEPVAKGARILARLVDGNLDEIAPCAQGVYENARGGRVCVNGYTPYVRHGNVHSIRQMRTVMRWLSRDALSGCLVGDGRALLWVRGDRSVVVVNFGADAEEGLSVDLAGEARSHGLVPVGVPDALPIVGERRGACTRYRLPTLAPWSVNVFALR